MLLYAVLWNTNVRGGSFRIGLNLKVSTFTWVAQARLKDGKELQPAPSQHGTLVWQILHEHPTRARPEN